MTAPETHLISIDRRMRLLVTAVALALIPQVARAQKVYWTDSRLDSLNRANLDGSAIEELRAQVVQSPHDIAVDETAGKLYWTEQFQKRPSISRCNLDGSNVEHFIQSVSFDLTGLALDPGGGKVYWAQHVHTGVAPGLRGEIHRADLDGTNIELLLADESAYPNGLAVDPVAGKMYVTDNVNNTVRRANLDGSEFETLVSATDAASIALDLPRGRMYWFDYSDDRVRRSSLDGTGVEVLTPLPPDQGVRLAVDEAAEQLYFAVHAVDRIQRADLAGAYLEDVVTADEGESLRFLALDTSAPKVYWHNSSQFGFQRANLDGSGVELILGGIRLRWASGIRLDRAAGKMYWCDQYFATLERSALDGSGFESMQGSGFNLRSWVLDPLSGKVYGLGDTGVQRMNIDGSELEEVITTDLVNPKTLAIDFAGQKLYWTDLRSRTQLELRRANSNGTNIEVVYTRDGRWMSHLTFDPVGGKVYWIDPVGLRRSDSEFTQIETLDLGTPPPTSLAIDLVENKLYFTTSEGESPSARRRLHRSDLDGSGVETILDDPARQPNAAAVDACGSDHGVRLSDLARILECLAGPGTYVEGTCHCADYSGDARVDLRDFAVFQRAFHGDR